MKTIHILWADAVCSRGAWMGMVLWLGAGGPLRADTVAFTGFEDPGALGDIAGTVQQIATSGALTNELGRHNVSHAAGPGLEMGFLTAWQTNAGSAGDGIGPVTSSGDTSDLVGVTDLAPPGGFTQGSFGFIFEDADGELTVTFDAVDFTGYRDATVSLDLFTAASTWEASDYLRVLVSGPGTNLTVLDTLGLDIDNLGFEGAWTNLSASLDGFGQATLQVVFSGNAADERAWLDNVLFSGAPIPEPSTAWLLGTGACVLGLAFRRRRRQS